MITQDNTVGFAIDSRIFHEFIKGKRNTYTVDVDNSTCNALLENIQGRLLLSTDNMPEEYYSCFYYNGGEFPYILKKSLKHILLACNGERIVGKIVDVKFTPGKRFSHSKDSDGQNTEDSNGNCCIWSISFKLVPAE